jgi:hypothetical protein
MPAYSPNGQAVLVVGYTIQLSRVYYPRLQCLQLARVECHSAERSAEPSAGGVVQVALRIRRGGYADELSSGARGRVLSNVSAAGSLSSAVRQRQDNTIPAT